MKTKKDKILYYFCTIISFFMSVSIFAPWLTYRDETYTLYGFYAAVKNCGGLDQFAIGNNYIYPSYIFLMLPIAAGILSGIKTLLLIFKGRIRILSYIIYGLEWGYMASYFAFGGYLPLIPALAGPVLAFVDFMINRYLEDYKEITRKSKELKAKEKAEKEERKRRLFFPGKYSTYFYHIAFQNIKHSKSAYLLLIVSGSFSVTFLFTMLGIKNIMENVHTSEVLFLGNGMQGIMKEAIVTVIVINALMMAFSFTYYVRNKSLQERTMILLGTRSALLRKTRIMEYAVCLLISLVTGCGLGNIIILIFKAVVNRYSSIGALQNVDSSVYVSTILAFAAVTFISLICNNEIYSREKYREGIKKNKEKIPGNKVSMLCLMAGSVAAFIAFSNYSQRRYAESIYYSYLFMMGIVLILISLCVFWVKWTEKGKMHYKGIISRIPFTYHFTRTVRTLSMMLVIHFLVLSVYTMQFAGIMTVRPAEELYPYDFVCMAYPEDEEFFTELEKEQIEIQKYPMVRVTSVAGDAYDWKDALNNNYMKVLWPQGQHIGISESAYIELQKALGNEMEKLDLVGEEIHIVYQQDSSFKAHPLDWYLSRKKPYLKLGQPLRFYNFMNREELYPPRIVKSEEIRILTGMFGRGMQENIVVFSDEYFNTMEAEGPTEYYLLNVDERDYGFAKEKLNEFEQKHLEDSSWDREIRPYYEKKQMIKDTKSERLLKGVVTAFEILMLMVCSILIISLKFIAEYGEMKERYELLLKIGMKSQERRRTLRKEIKPFFTLPVILAAGLAVCFTLVMFELRMYGQVQTVEYLKCAAMVWMIYFLVQAGVYQCVKNRLYRVAEENETGGKRK